jgi:hypothetical protein
MPEELALPGKLKSRSVACFDFIAPSVESTMSQLTQTSIYIKNFVLPFSLAM